MNGNAKYVYCYPANKKEIDPRNAIFFKPHFDLEVQLLAKDEEPSQTSDNL
jgi:hypothetical protein